MLTKADLDRFCDFAMAKIQNGGLSSLEECVRLWTEQEEYEQSLAALRESLADSAAGRTKPASQVEEEIRREFALRERERAS